jgi:hypothetical protein
MASTTTNYGFDVPTSSDLVKNGATQIALLGQDLDTFLFRPFTRNGVLNSGFNVWQRGTSVAGVTAINYTADQWIGFRSGFTFTRQATGDTTNLPNIQYCARVQRNSGTSGTSVVVFSQSLETINSIPYAGKQVTFSYYARKGANFSSNLDSLSAQVYSGTGTDQTQVGGYTGQATPINTGAALTTTWQRFTTTGTIAATATELSINFSYTPVGTAGANDYFEVTGVMLEVGNQASPYTPATPTYATELAACQRYYFRTAFPGRYGSGFAKTTTTAAIITNLPVPMRIQPTALEQSGTASDYLLVYQASASACSSVPTFSNASGTVAETTFTVGAVLTAGNGVNAGSNSSNAYLGWSAEL